MSVYKLILKRRSIRRFEKKKIPLETLKKLVNAAKFAPSGERPVAYIILLVNKNIRREGYEHDLGAAAQNIMLTALEEGIGSCWLGSIKREDLREILNVPEDYLVDTVISLGYPKESLLAEDLPSEKPPTKESIRYYKDKNNVLHVPKRRLEDILHINGW